MKVSLNDVRFSQDSIKDRFKDGRTFETLFQQIAEDPDYIHRIRSIPVVLRYGKYWAFDGNRRLFVYKKLQEFGVLHKIDVSTGYWNQNKFTTINGGTSISVRFVNATTFHKRFQDIWTEIKNRRKAKEDQLSESLHKLSLQEKNYKHRDSQTGRRQTTSSRVSRTDSVRHRNLRAERQEDMTSTVQESHLYLLWKAKFEVNNLKTFLQLMQDEQKVSTIQEYLPIFHKKIEHHAKTFNIIQETYSLTTAEAREHVRHHDEACTLYTDLTRLVARIRTEGNVVATYPARNHVVTVKEELKKIQTDTEKKMKMIQWMESEGFTYTAEENRPELYRLLKSFESGLKKACKENELSEADLNVYVECYHSAVCYYNGL